MKIVLATILLVPWLLASQAPCSDPRQLADMPVLTSSVAADGQIGPLLAVQIL